MSRGTERPRRGWPGLVAALLFAGGCGGGVAELPVVEAPPGPVVVVERERDATAVGLAVLLPGSGWETDATSGLTLLSARAALEEVAAATEAVGAEVEVLCGRWGFAVTLVSPPGTWREAARLVAGALSRPVVEASAVERARTALAGTLALDRANPAWQARLAAFRALYGGAGDGADATGSGGGESSWSRPPCGVVETLGLFGSDAIAGMAERLGAFGSVAVVGAVEADADSVVRALFRPIPVPAPFPEPPVPGPGRVYVERNTVTAWVAVGWPFEAGADPEAVGLVGALLEEEVGPAVTRPGVLAVSSEVELHGGGGALVVTVVVEPGRAAAVASSLEEAVARLAAGRQAAGVLERVARRHRGERLRALATPESRAVRLAVSRARGAAAGPWPDPRSYTASAVRAAAGALGAPARAVVGPRSARGAAVP